MNVVFLSPNYPPEMHEYTKALARAGARVFGVGDSPRAGLAPGVQQALTDYLEVPRIMDEADVQERIRQWLQGKSIDRLEALWEPLVLSGAKMRDHFAISGMSHNQALGFRDKELMKERIRAAGLRVPHSARVQTKKQAHEAVERIGFPVILKPIQGAGSADTYRCNDVSELEHALSRMGHVNEASCEEFVEGEEFTHDTICVDGRPVYENVAQYLPRPLEARTHEWISPVICTVRNLDQPALADGLALGRGVLQALGMTTGFTHMEWYRKSDGEVVFGEIGYRPGGAHLADQMNFTGDTDVFMGWANAVCHGQIGQPTERKYNTAIVFKRARGQGRITRIEGLAAWRDRCNGWGCAEALLPVGSPRRNWRQTLVSDGFVMVRHPEWKSAVAMATDAAENIQLWAS